MRRRRQMMQSAGGHSSRAKAAATPRAGPRHYVSRQPGRPCQASAGPANGVDWARRRGDGLAGGLKSRLRRPAAAAPTQQKKSQTKITTTRRSSSSSSPVPVPVPVPVPSQCCCRVNNRTKTSRPVSILKKTHTFKSSQKSRPMLLGQPVAQALRTSGLESHQQRPPPPPPSSSSSSSSPSTADEMEMIKRVSRDFAWTWDESCCSHTTRECQINRNGDKLEVCFHPLGSESTAACRGAKPLIRNGNYYYWELTVSEKCYGTSVMFGLCTLGQSLHAMEYCNLIGLDECGWSLSHKGLIWHDGKSRQFAAGFPANQQITIGLLFNTMRGELSYFMNGKNLGVAFCGLNDIQDDLYPAVGSTAKNTKVRITGSYCGYVSLLERSCFSILKNHSYKREQLIDYLNRCRLPRNLIEYLSQVAELCGNPIAIKTTNHQEQIEENNNNQNIDRIIIA